MAYSVLPFSSLFPVQMLLTSAGSYTRQRQNIQELSSITLTSYIQGIYEVSFSESKNKWGLPNLITKQICYN